MYSKIYIFNTTLLPTVALHRSSAGFLTVATSTQQFHHLVHILIEAGSKNKTRTEDQTLQHVEMLVKCTV